MGPGLAASSASSTGVPRGRVQCDMLEVAVLDITLGKVHLSRLQEWGSGLDKYESLYVLAGLCIIRTDTKVCMSLLLYRNTGDSVIFYKIPLRIRNKAAGTRPTAAPSKIPMQGRNPKVPATSLHMHNSGTCKPAKADRSKQAAAEKRAKVHQARDSTMWNRGCLLFIPRLSDGAGSAFRLLYLTYLF